MPEVTLEVTEDELSLEETLKPGQSFLWREGSEEGEFESVACSGDRVLLRRTSPKTVLARFGCPETEAVLRDHLRLDCSLEGLAKKWRSGSGGLARLLGETERRGVRLLRQRPASECLLSFVCSQNNNVKRIAGLVERLRQRFGYPVGLVAEDGGQDRAVCGAPDLSRVAESSEEDLREMGLGYRADYVLSTSREVLRRGGERWLEELRGKDVSRERAKEALVGSLKGVGPKVADCVLLYSLEKTDAVPVDVHVLGLAKRAGVINRSEAERPSKVTGQKVADAFRAEFGEMAGWAQAIMFSSDLD